MKNGIILETAVPVRNEASDRSEMVNQLLFGEDYSVLVEKEKWIQIKSTHDNYVGWIDIKQHKEFQIQQERECICAEVSLEHESRGKVRVLAGSLMPHGEELEQLGFKSVQTSANFIDLKEAMSLFMDAPYLWGGRTNLGIDCSGFTQLVFRMLGESIPRDASEQVLLGETIAFIGEAEAGDLAFFDNAEGKITHVGIIGIEEHTIIHASGRVRTDSIDQNGIFNADTKSYSHNLRTIKRIT